MKNHGHHARPFLALPGERVTPEKSNQFGGPVPAPKRGAGAAIRQLRGWSRLLLVRGESGGRFDVGSQGGSRRAESLVEAVEWLGIAGEIFGRDVEPGGFSDRGPIFHAFSTIADLRYRGARSNALPRAPPGPPRSSIAGWSPSTRTSCIPGRA